MKVYTILKNIAKKVSLDYVHPVGEIFISTDSTFDPNRTWGGVWVKLTDKFLVGAGNVYAVGDVGGEATHTLIENELPKTSGNFIIRNTNGGVSTIMNTSGHFSKSQSSSSFAAFSYTTSTNAETVTFAFGNDQPHNNLPPYQAVFMWQRTA